METLFWAIFGLIDLENLALKEEHVITEWSVQTAPPYSPPFPLSLSLYRAGKTMFGTYSIISIVRPSPSLSLPLLSKHPCLLRVACHSVSNRTFRTRASQTVCFEQFGLGYKLSEIKSCCCLCKLANKAVHSLQRDTISR